MRKRTRLVVCVVCIWIGVAEQIPRGQITSVAQADVVCAVTEGTTICPGHRFHTTGNAFARLPV